MKNAGFIIAFPKKTTAMAFPPRGNAWVTTLNIAPTEFYTTSIAGIALAKRFLFTAPTIIIAIPALPARVSIPLANANAPPASK